MREHKEEQVLCYAVKACHMLGMSVEQAAKALDEPEAVIKNVYKFIERDLIDFSGNW